MIRLAWIRPLAVAGLIVLLAWFEPRGPLLCPFRALTELPCPLCGITRSLHFLLRADLSSALAMHPLAPLALALLAACAIRVPPLRAWTVVGAIFLAFGVLRIATLTL